MHKIITPICRNTTARSMGYKTRNIVPILLSLILIINMELLIGKDLLLVRQIHIRYINRHHLHWTLPLENKSHLHRIYLLRSPK